MCANKEKTNAYGKKDRERKKLYTNACYKEGKKEQTTNACGKERKKEQTINGAGKRKMAVLIRHANTELTDTKRKKQNGWTHLQNPNLEA